MYTSFFIHQAPRILAGMYILWDPLHICVSFVVHVLFIFSFPSCLTLIFSFVSSERVIEIWIRKSFVFGCSTFLYFFFSLFYHSLVSLEERGDCCNYVLLCPQLGSSLDEQNKHIIMRQFFLCFCRFLYSSKYLFVISITVQTLKTMH